MNCTRPLPLRLILMVPILLLGTRSAALTGPAPGTVPVLDWIAQEEAFLAAHPEGREEPDGEPAPVERVRAFLESRLTPDGTPPTREDLLKVITEAQAQRNMLRAGSNQYFELGPTNIPGRILDIEFDPNVAGRVYAATSGGGIARSTDGGNHWSMMTDQLATLATSGIEVDPSDSNRLVVTTGGIARTFIQGLGIFYSTDAGATWNPSNLTGASPYIGFDDLLVTSGGIWLACSDQGLWRSTDGGVTWNAVMASGVWRDVLVSGFAYAIMDDDGAGNGGIYRSTDQGLTWAISGTGQPASANIRNGKLAAGGGKVFALPGDFANDGVLGLWSSTDAGNTWTQSGTGPEGFPNNFSGINGGIGPGGQVRSGFNLILAVDPANANNMAAGAQVLMVTTDGGVTWSGSGSQDSNSIATPHVDFHASVWRNNGTLWVGTDGGIYSTTDVGTTWTERSAGLSCFLFWDVCTGQSDPLALFGGAQDNRAEQYLGAQTWQILGPIGSGDGGVCVVDPVSSQNVYVEKQNGNHYRSTDGGVTWTASNIGLGGTSNGEFLTPVAIDPSNPAILYTATNSSSNNGPGLRRTTDGMQTWNLVESVQPHVIAVSPAGTTIWTSRNDNALPRVSTDGGTTFADVALPFTPTSDATAIAVPGASDTDCLIAYGGYSTGLPHVIRLSSSGALVADVTGDLPDVPVNGVAVDPAGSGWYVGTDVGVYRSSDLGTSWVPYGAGLPNVVVMDVEINAAARKLVVGTFGRGLWVVDLPGATGAPDVAVGPRDLMLDPPYPSPTTDRALLRFAARRDGDARLGVFDVTGRLVTALAEFPADGVVRTVPWFVDGRAAGVYFAVLQAGEERISRKIVVTR